jgi:hypothetical protein
VLPAKPLGVVRIEVQADALGGVEQRRVEGGEVLLDQELAVDEELGPARLGEALTPAGDTRYPLRLATPVQTGRACANS